MHCKIFNNINKGFFRRFGRLQHINCQGLCGNTPIQPFITLLTAVMCFVSFLSFCFSSFFFCFSQITLSQYNTIINRSTKEFFFFLKKAVTALNWQIPIYLHMLTVYCVQAFSPHSWIHFHVQNWEIHERCWILKEMSTRQLRIQPRVCKKPLWYIWNV